MAGDVPLQPGSYLAYVPSLGGNIAIGVLYAVLLLITTGHTARWRSWRWSTVQLVGLFFASLGYFIRIPMRTQQENQGLYIPMYLFVVLSPAAFLAFNYIVLGRLVSTLDPSLAERPGLRARSRYLFVPPRMVARVFVTSDVCTFLVQACGGALQTSGLKFRKTGDRIFLVGVTLQGVSYAFFTLLAVVAHRRLAREKAREGRPLRAGSWTSWTFMLLYVSSAGILARSVYRIVEMSQGYSGNLYSHEIYVFTVDALPLLIATGTWAAVFPARLFNHVKREAEEDAESLALEKPAAVAGSNAADARGDAAPAPAPVSASEPSLAPSKPHSLQPAYAPPPSISEYTEHARPSTRGSGTDFDQ